MKRLYKVLTICSLVIILGTSAIKSVQNSGNPPSGYTGATTSTCISCHGGNSVNTAGGSVATTGLPTVAAGYTLGKTYSFSLTITHASSNRKRWGFAIKAINASGAVVGTFTTTNANANASSAAIGELRHQSAPITTVNSTYTFSNLTWKAPATNTLTDKTIRFYFVGLAANGTGGTDGDFVYSASLSTPQAVSIAVNSFTPTKASAGDVVTIKGIGFNGATAVSFGGTNAASFSVTNDTTMSAILGSGASGIVSVTSPSGTGTLAGFTFCPTATTQNLSFTGCTSYTYNGVTYTSSTLKKDTIKTVKGCDSIYKNATITIRNLTPTTKNLNFSGCNSYVYNGVTYTSSTIKRDTIRTNLGCDSVYRVANITIASTPTIKNSGLAGCGSVLYNGVTYTSSTQKIDTVKNTQGCDSIYNNVSINISHNFMGNIKHPVKGDIATVLAKLTGSLSSTILTSSKYAFNCMPDSTNGTVKLSKNNDVKKNNGVSGIDIILVTNHILNKTKLNNAYKIIAADVNNDKLVTGIDAIFMKRLVLGTDTTFAGKRLWAFVDSAYHFADTTNPFPYKDSISFTNLTSNIAYQTFIGVKLGDVNFDWNPSLARGQSIDNVELIVDNAVNPTPNTQYLIPIKVKNFKDLTAMQYTLNFNYNDYEFVGIENNKLGFEFNDKQANYNGSIGFLWTDAKAEPKSIDDEGEIFTLVFRKRGLGNLQLSIGETITNIEAWDNNYQQHNIVLTQKTSNIIPQVLNNDFVIFPNPASDILNIQFAKADVKQIKILNAFGNILYSNNTTVTTKSAQLFVKNLATGTYFIEITTNENKVVKRFIKN